MEKFTAVCNRFIEDVNNEEGKSLQLIDRLLRFLFIAVLLVGIPIISVATIQLFHLL
ncbi:MULTISPECIES: hypothetical protein [Cytobacillus]|uniref:Uncharacterized protein n=1 Tax=Cytobacillus stercorigallinarum TaxID=2762240 RepID=A0ABR8QL19_9BACI|nr:hypothetical protein [Cytobacillus stercorigallinarum]MBD7936210.1 hypothetical protein [Cytobacillus stercorigallinarum]